MPIARRACDASPGKRILDITPTYHSAVSAANEAPAHVTTGSKTPHTMTQGAPRITGDAVTGGKAAEARHRAQVMADPLDPGQPKGDQAVVLRRRVSGLTDLVSHMDRLNAGAHRRRGVRAEELSPMRHPSNCYAGGRHRGAGVDGTPRVGLEAGKWRAHLGGRTRTSTVVPPSALPSSRYVLPWERTFSPSDLPPARSSFSH